MKHSSIVINHLKKDPSLLHLQKLDSYKKLLGLLPQSISRGVVFCYNKNDTLFFVLEHPGYKMEFNYKTNLIKDLLKQLIRFDPNCSLIDASSVKCFVTNKVPFVQNIEEIKPLIYKERSFGKFQNISTIQEISDIFEEIRRTICSRQS